MKFRFAWLVVATCILLTGACAVQQQQIVERLRPTSGEEVEVLTSPVIIKAAGAKKVTLQAGTRWTRRGEISKGSVYSTQDQVVIVESYNTREAYLVVDAGRVVGFYLPVEHTFVEAGPTQIRLNTQGEEVHE